MIPRKLYSGARDGISRFSSSRCPKPQLSFQTNSGQASRSVPCGYSVRRKRSARLNIFQTDALFLGPAIIENHRLIRYLDVKFDIRNRGHVHLCYDRGFEGHYPQLESAWDGIDHHPVAEGTCIGWSY